MAIGCSFTIQAHQDTFQESGDTCASFTMSNVGLGRGDHHRLMPGHHRHHLLVGSDLDRITKRCTGAMALSGIHLRRLHADLFDDCLQASLLCWSVRSCQRCTSSILVNLASCTDAIVPLLPFKGLQLERTRRGSLPSSVAISREVVSETSAKMRVHACATATDVGHRAEAEIDSTNNDGLARIEVLMQQIQLAGVGCYQG
mmetsp:Transcript_61214/g.96900  ORF Transcript_61214/g.96900 Transcript_61214/m.96900 type:complete len:201 (-) Transcript_61214:1153-1755(-)